MVEATAVDWDSSRQAWRRRAPTGPDPFFAPMEIAMLLSRSRHLLRPTVVAVCAVAAFVLADGSTPCRPWRRPGVGRGWAGHSSRGQRGHGPADADGGLSAQGSRTILLDFL